MHNPTAPKLDEHALGQMIMSQLTGLVAAGLATPEAAAVALRDLGAAHESVRAYLAGAAGAVAQAMQAAAAPQNGASGAM